MATNVKGYTCQKCGCTDNKMYWDDFFSEFIIRCGDCQTPIQAHDETMYRTNIPTIKEEN